MDQINTTPPKKPTRPKKKPYSKPVLREYGDLRRVTEANVAALAVPDGAPPDGTMFLKTGG